jgi:hypothetical protein
MTTPLPTPDCGVHYTEEQIQAYGKAEYERALLDAMNATRAFGKTGEVIAVIIAALKEKKE